jgi:hypothetical protein
MIKEKKNLALHCGILISILIPILLSGCKEESLTYLDDHYARLERVPQEKLLSLSHKKVFFGHQSVGQNIVDGITDVMGTTPLIRLNIRETMSPGDFDKPIFAHSFIGTNLNPSSKIKAFRDILDSGVGQVADIAFLKLCYIDINRSTDLRALFKEYDETIAYLKAKFPKLKIITVTVPLMSRPIRIRSKIAKLLGRWQWDDQNNVKRNEFNEMLRSRYGESLFDLAKSESTTLLGKRAVFKKDNKTYDLLVKSYTDDGGHLNALGRQVAAIDLLLYLLSGGLDQLPPDTGKKANPGL